MSDLGICRTFFQRIVQVFEVIQAHADKAGLWEQLWRWSPLSQVQPPSRPPPPSLTVSWRTRVHSSPPTLFQPLHSFSSTGPRPDQGGVEPLEVVGSHEDYPALRGGDSVDGIEEATEGEPVGALIGGLGFGV